MASERQAAANRENARRSTGPRSADGKKRAGQNAVRHGLFSLATRVSALEEIEALARAFAGDGADEIALEHARSAAEASIEVNRARRVRLALIERVESLGSLEVPQGFPKSVTSLRDLDQLPPPEDVVGSMPAEGPERTLEAIRRAMPELERLTVYEKRAAARRDRAIRLLAGLT